MWLSRYFLLSIIFEIFDRHLTFNMHMQKLLFVPPHLPCVYSSNYVMTLHVNMMIAFNADKSKLLICRSFKQCKVVRDIKGRPFHIGGRDIEQVDSFSHLGHIITSDFSDTEDIRYRRNRFVGQVNNCLFFQ